MGFSLKKLLEGAAAQVNMNDGGKTFATVVRNQPVQSQPAKTPPPSYGSNPVKQAINRTRDVFDANTPQDRFKRQLAQKPVIDFTAQDRARQTLNGVKNVAGNYAKGFVESYNQVGTGLGTLLAQNSADVKNAQKAQNNLADQLHQQRMAAIKTAKNPNLNDVQRNRLNNYYNSLDRADVDLQNSRTQQSNDLYSKLDPKKNLAAIGSVGFDIATLGVGTGGTQAVKQAFKSGIKTGAKELGGQMVKTGSLGAVSGGLSPIVQKGDQATAKDILQGAGMGFAMGAALPAVAPAVKFGGSKAVNTVKGLTKENIGAISPRLKLNNQKGFARSTEESPVLKKLGIVKDGKAMSVDPKSAPIEKTYYHGSSNPEIKEFNINKAKGGIKVDALGSGVYLTPDKNVAKKYGDNIYSIGVGKETKIVELGTKTNWADNDQLLKLKDSLNKRGIDAEIGADGTTLTTKHGVIDANNPDTLLSAIQEARRGWDGGNIEKAFDDAGINGLMNPKRNEVVVFDPGKAKVTPPKSSAPIEKTPKKPITVYRGDYTREQALNNAISTSLDPNVAKSFSDNGKIRKFTVDPSAKVIDITTLRKQILGVDKFPDPDTLTKEQFDSITGDGLINYAKANGYDVIDHSKAGIKSSGIRPGKLLDEQEYQIVNDKVLKELPQSGAPIEKTPTGRFNTVEDLVKEIQRPKVGRQGIKATPEEIAQLHNLTAGNLDPSAQKWVGKVVKTSNARNVNPTVVIGKGGDNWIVAELEQVNGKWQPSGEVRIHSTPMSDNPRDMFYTQTLGDLKELNKQTPPTQKPNIGIDSGAPIEKTAKQLQVQQTPFGPVKAKTDPGLDPVVNRTQKVVEMQQKSEKLLPESKPTSKMLTKDSVKASSSNNTPDQNELPLYKTHQVSNLDKAFRSTRSIIERQGEKGKQLAGMLQKQRDTKELYVREIEKQISTVQSLKGKDYENFVDATQGLAKPNNPKVAQAIKEWHSVHPGIRDRAVNAGLDVGDLGETYYPHFIDYDKIFKNKNTYNEAINHLVKTGQAETPEKAIELLSYARDVSRNRKFGNLEASRLVDLPFYDKSKASLGMYIDGSADRITKTEMFGKGDENALKLIKEAGLDGYDTEAMKNAYDVAVGAKQYNPTTSKISKGIRQFTTTTRLGLGALTNVSQSVNTGIVTGHLRTMKSIIKQFDPKTRQLAEDTGVISDAILNDLKHGFGAEYNKGKFGKVVNVITAPGFKQVESFNRRVAATAGRDYALRLAQKGDEATLRKLGVTGVIKNGTLTNSQQTQAARKIVEKTQFKVDPQDLPGWADSPGGKLVAQFRTFSYNQGKFFSNEILKPLAKGNIMPLGRLMAALPLGYGLYEVRRKIDGRPEEENKAKVGLQSFQKIGGAGLVFDIYQGLNPVGSKYLPSDRRVTMAFGTIGGPSIGTAGNAIGAISEAIQRKNTPKDESRLGGKVVVAKNDNSYTDLTAISRFGMQQVPIIGTAMANRVLPYKKQAEAEAGKPLGTNQTQMTREDQLKDAKNSIKYGAGKEWQNLSEEDIKNKAIAGDQTAAGIYKSLQTMEKVYGAKNIPTPGLSTAAEDVLNQSKKITKEGESAWGSRPTENKGAQKAISQLAGEELQVDNATAEKWAKYERDRVTGKINELDKVKIQRDILKSAYSSTLSADEKKYFSYNDTDLINALQNGSLKPDSLAKAMSVDAQLVAKGLITTSGFGKKVWNALGLAYPSVKGTSTKARTSSRRVASKKLKTTKTISLDTFKKYKTRRSSTNSALRKLLGSAKV